MTRRRWIADELDGDRAALTGQNAGHLSRVLRARVGQEFDIACGDNVRVGRIRAINKDRVEFELGDTVAETVGTHITVWLAVFKFDRMEWAIEKCTELGVSKIVPVIAQRTDAHLVTAATKRAERWRRIAHEAAQQSRRAAPPEITDPVRLKDALADEGKSVRVVLAENEKNFTLADVMKENPDDGPMSLAVGPEGGWTDEELKQFVAAGWATASLGPTILRAETAAIAAVAIVAAL